MAMACVGVKTKAQDFGTERSQAGCRRLVLIVWKGMPAKYFLADGDD
jgi:hypothetical protein